MDRTPFLSSITTEGDVMMPTSVATPLEPIHPGTFLRAELLEPLHLSQHAIARATGLPVSRINQIILGRRSISAETDLRLCRYFGFSHGYFLRWQATYDQQVAERDFGDLIDREVIPREMAEIS